MPDAPLAPDRLATLPKVELHVHLEGTVDAALATALARRHGADPDRALRLVDGDYPGAYDGFGPFLETFLATSRQVRTPQDLADVATAFARGQAAQGVAYTEVTCTADTLVQGGLPADELWAALREGLAAEPAAEIALVLDVVRDTGAAGLERTLGLLADADAPIVALGLTGMEGSVPERDFRALREAADERRLGLTVHAGETGGAANVAAAIDDLGADRIGHGIAVLDDPALTARLAARGTAFEVCPSSNVALGLADDLASHPLRAMRDAGLRVCVSSDDPPLFATTLTDEVGHAARLLGLDEPGLARLQRTAVDASFASPATRRRLHEALDAWLTDGGYL